MIDCYEEIQGSTANRNSICADSNFDPDHKINLQNTKTKYVVFTKKKYEKVEMNITKQR